MKEITLEELLEAGCHFGHQVTRQNPKARDFVFEARDNIHIIDLAKTKEGLDEAAAYVRDIASKGGTMVLVGTKRQARNLVEESVQLAKTEGAGEGLYFVINRWIGGTLTNLSEVAKNYKKYNDLDLKLKNDEEKAKYTKREVSLWDREKNKLERFYGGVLELKKTPDVLFIIDTHLEEMAVKEANRMGVKIVGIVDTNADPDVIDFPIAANDDAVGSIKLILGHIIEAWIEGKKNPKVKEEPKAEVKPVQNVQEKEEVKDKKAEAEKEVKKEEAPKEKKKSKIKVEKSKTSSKLKDKKI